MATTKRVICLANSRKGGQRCVAGRELIEEGVGGWLRPVSGSDGSIGLWERQYADAVEHGIARLLGKTVRQRADELISVAHPDFRAELRKAAQRLFYP